MTQHRRDRSAAMPIRPVQPTDYAEWLRMRLHWWGGAAEEHTYDIDTYFATPQRGVTFVVERCGGGLCGFIEVSLRDYAEGCQTSPVATLKDGTWMRKAVVAHWAPVSCRQQRHGRGIRD